MIYNELEFNSFNYVSSSVQVSSIVSMYTAVFKVGYTDAVSVVTMSNVTRLQW